MIRALKSGQQTNLIVVIGLVATFCSPSLYTQAFNIKKPFNECLTHSVKRCFVLQEGFKWQFTDKFT